MPDQRAASTSSEIARTFTPARVPLSQSAMRMTSRTVMIRLMNRCAVTLNDQIRKLDSPNGLGLIATSGRTGKFRVAIALSRSMKARERVDSVRRGRNAIRRFITIRPYSPPITPPAAIRKSSALMPPHL